MRAIKGFLAISHFRVLVATSMDNSERCESAFGRSAHAPYPHRVARDLLKVGNGIRVNQQADIQLVVSTVDHDGYPPCCTNGVQRSEAQ